jgi:hypothetical protein
VSREYILIAPNQNDSFWTGNSWSAEYPNARLYPNLQAARRVRDGLDVDQIAIYSTQQYQEGLGPTVRADE